jgi:hypothetical protein
VKVYEFVCPQCGKVKRVDRPSKIGKFCSHACADASRRKYPVKVKVEVEPRDVCKYNDGCRCSTQDCDRCGWNPVVAQARLMKFLGIQWKGM